MSEEPAGPPSSQLINEPEGILLLRYKPLILARMLADELKYSSLRALDVSLL